jgi:hypothetical protein
VFSFPGRTITVVTLCLAVGLHWLTLQSVGWTAMMFCNVTQVSFCQAFRGKPAEDTGITSVFVGPRLVGSRGRWSADIDVDLPVLIHNTALQVVPDYRIRGGVSFHF